MKFKGLAIGVLISLMLPSCVFAQNMSVPNVDSSFKSYMPYTTITDKSSKQWDLQKEAKTHSNGIRVHESGRYMVAVGTYYAEEVGEKLNITLDNGYVVYAIVGDLKQDRHTDSTNRYVPVNDSILEFIVDDGEIPDLAMKMGDISYADENLQGKVVKIKKID